ncbi:hypothetical protein [Streptomyces sp. NPDC002088]|uniref:hypothetical protein n=1 Tax=Streptomyces sp. NPDC002088 TaxID=3154665 RepID=UPI00331E6AD1
MSGSEVTYKKIKSWRPSTIRPPLTKYEAYYDGTKIGFVESKFKEIETGDSAGADAHTKSWLLYLEGDVPDHSFPTENNPDETYSRGEAGRMLLDEYRRRQKLEE